LLRWGTVETVAILLDRHLGNHRQAADAADSGDGSQQFGHVPERFHDEQVDASRQQRLGLLTKVSLSFVPPHPAPRLDTQPKRTDRPGDVGLTVRGTSGDAGTLDIDVVQAVGKAEAAEFNPIGTKRIGFDDVRACAYVLIVHLRHSAGVGEIQCVETTVDEDALGIEHRADRAVTDEHTFVECVKEWRHANEELANDWCARGRRIGWRRHEQRILVPDKVVLAVDSQLVILTHENGGDGAGLLTIAAEDAARLMNLVDLGVARTRQNRAVVFLGLEIDRVGGAGSRTQTTGHALLQPVLVPHQHLFTPVLREHRHFLLGVIYRHLLLKHVTEGSGQSDEKRSNHLKLMIIQ
jgi:hypothetical protein